MPAKRCLFMTFFNFKNKINIIGMIIPMKEYLRRSPIPAKNQKNTKYFGLFSFSIFQEK